MRVLSPRIDPPLRVLDGSTASTATRWPASMTCRPTASINVDLPTPGDPETPTRVDRPVSGRTAASSALASVAVVGAGRLDERDPLRERAPVTGDDLRREAAAHGLTVPARLRETLATVRCAREPPSAAVSRGSDMADQCRAAVFPGDSTYEVREFDIPEPPPGGAR